MQKGFATIIILVGILVLAAVGGAYYFFKVKTPAQKACTMDAKICPDGSSVGRSGPNCEFSPCPPLKPTTIPNASREPNGSAETANWKTYQNSKLGYEFKYPPEWNESQSELGNPEFGIQYFKDGKFWTIVSNYISKEALSDMGVTYCGAYPEDKRRCEQKQIRGGLKVAIDWGLGTRESDPAYANVSHPKGGIVTFTLKPVTSETKIAFNQMLSTFKFLDQINTEGKICGGLAGNLPENQCPTGYKCKIDGRVELDATGKCVKQ